MDTWWGRAWEENLERYADFFNRLEQGKNVEVSMLDREDGEITATVSSYRVDIIIDPLSPAKRKALEASLSKQPEGIKELRANSFPTTLSDLLPSILFPAPEEIHFSCTCPDGARLCAHVAAVLHILGLRFDSDPKLIFCLRGLEPDSFLESILSDSARRLLSRSRRKSARQLDGKTARSLFGLLNEQ